MITRMRAAADAVSEARNIGGRVLTHALVDELRDAVYEYLENLEAASPPNPSVASVASKLHTVEVQVDDLTRKLRHAEVLERSAVRYAMQRDADVAAADARVARLKAEVANLQEAARRKDLELHDLRERGAQEMEAYAGNYPEDVFPPDSDSRDAVAGTAMRHAYTNAARMLREVPL